MVQLLRGVMFLAVPVRVVIRLAGTNSFVELLLSFLQGSTIDFVPLDARPPGEHACDGQHQECLQEVELKCVGEAQKSHSGGNHGQRPEVNLHELPLRDAWRLLLYVLHERQPCSHEKHGERHSDEECTQYFQNDSSDDIHF